MSQNLYEEAIAEARRLRDMAEENAKNKIIDAVTPRIRNLIEQQLLDEADEETDELAPGDDPDMADAESVTVDLDALSSEEVPAAPAAHAGEAPEVEDAEAANISIGADGEISLGVGGLEIEIDASGNDGEEELMDDQVAEA